MFVFGTLVAVLTADDPGRLFDRAQPGADRHTGSATSLDDMSTSRTWSLLLGLGVGIDYSLFIVYRFREELRATGNDVEAALVRTMSTTGRAVFFSGLTVAIGLSSLILTQVSFMEAMGLGGMLVPLTALVVAMTFLPAMLGLLGTRVNTPVFRRCWSA